MNEPQGEETIFAEALRLPADERAAYLAKSTSGNPELRQRVEALLGSYQAGDFLEQSAATQLHLTRHITVPLTEKSGDTIGRYKLLQQIGEGGCGVVYMAEQAEPVRRRVALKIIKLGMDTKSVIARFEAERQAVAMMDHPNIAKVFDAGATEAGRPYFVMELVRGMKITDYCDEAKLSTRARLDLFIQVCQAIQHAHQKGIIHRDIKPSNILVTMNDGVAVPKVIDFGIAKATNGQQLTDRTVFTAFEQFIGTPAYMSPEQAVLTSLDIDTRSDIYALGVLLYELLTGKTPFDAKELLAIGLDEMRRTIREQEPPRPSTRLSTLPGQELSTTAQRRGLEAPKLVSELRGDLDWIVMKALEKDRARRYETANGLARDIQRYLGNEPVVARPPSKVYQLQKLARRNKLAFAAGAAVIVGLSLGLGISTWSLMKERQARQRAMAAEQETKTEAAKSRQVAQFLKDMLKGVGPSVALGKDTTLLKEILDKTVERLGKDLTNQHEVKAELQNVLGGVYDELGQYDQAEEILRKALTTRRQLFGDNDLQVAASLHNLAFAFWRQGRLDRAKLAEAERLHREALAVRRQLLGNQHPDVLESLNDLALVLQNEGKFQEAEAMHREVLNVRKKSKTEDEEVTTSLNNLALVLRSQGRLPEAESILRDALELSRKLHRGDGPQAATLLVSLGQLQNHAGKWPEAEATLREVLVLRRKLLGEGHPHTIATLHSLGANLRDQGRVAEAENIYREALATESKASAGKESLAVATAINTLANLLREQKKLAEAEALLRESLAITKKLQPDGGRAASILSSLGAVLHLQARQPEGEAAFREAELLYNKLLPDADLGKPESFAFLRERGYFLASRGKWKEAAADYAKMIELSPADERGYCSLALLLATAGDMNGYRQLCQRMLTSFADTNDRHAAERIARICLLLPSSGCDAGLVAALAERALKMRETSWTQLCMGFSELRQRRYATAIEWAEKSLGQPGPPARAELRDAHAYMILAIAHHEMRQIDQARITLAKGVELAESKLPSFDSGYVGDGWYERLIADALMKEVKALIEGRSATRAETK